MKPHTEYPLVKETEADGIAFAFYGPSEPAVRYPFKFPPIKPNEIRVKQTYFGLCYSDCHLVQQDWFDVPFPIVPGHEILGRVTLLGSDVKNFKVGDLVGFGFIRDSCGKCEYCDVGDDQLCQSAGDNHFMPIPHFGGFATHVQAPAKWAFPIPASIPEELCSPLLCAGITTYAPLKRHGRPGYECAIIGIGGLGHLAIKIAAALGMKTTVISTSANKKDEAFSYGAVDFILSTDAQAMKKNSNRFDIVLNCAHASNSEQLVSYIDLTKAGGDFIQIGIPSKSSDLSIPFSTIVMSQKSIVGSMVGSRIENFEMLEFVAKHKIYPVVEVFQFEEFNKAYQHLLKGTPRYRCVIKI